MTDMVPDPERQKAYNQRLTRLLVRMSVYYLSLFICLYIAIRLIPGFPDYLPVGGLDQYAGQAATDLSGIRSDSRPISEYIWVTDGVRLFLAMLGSLILMIPVAWVHSAIHSGHEYDHSIDETALVLPSVVAGVVMVVQHSLALAFSLAGIVAGVRFRRALSDTFDTLFIFVAVGVGLAAGVAAVEIALIITVFFNFATVMICIFGDGLESRYAARRKRDRRRRKSEAAKQSSDTSSVPSDTP